MNILIFRFYYENERFITLNEIYAYIEEMILNISSIKKISSNYLLAAA